MFGRNNAKAMPTSKAGLAGKQEAFWCQNGLAPLVIYATGSHIVTFCGAAGNAGAWEAQCGLGLYSGGEQRHI